MPPSVARLEWVWMVERTIHWAQQLYLDDNRLRVNACIQLGIQRLSQSDQSSCLVKGQNKNTPGQELKQILSRSTIWLMH